MRGGPARYVSANTRATFSRLGNGRYPSRYPSSQTRQRGKKAYSTTAPRSENDSRLRSCVVDVSALPSPTQLVELPFTRTALVELALLAVAGGVLGAFVVLRRLAFFAHAVGTATFPGL